MSWEMVDSRSGDRGNSYIVKKDTRTVQLGLFYNDGKTYISLASQR